MQETNVVEELSALADRLSEILEEENRLLDGLDLAAAAGLLPRKRDAVTALQGAVAAGNLAAGLPPEEAVVLRASLDRMSALAQENRAAIERGVAMQMRVIQAIATAVPRARAVEAPVYQPDGSKAPPRPPEAYAFLSRM